MKSTWNTTDYSYKDWTWFTFDDTSENPIEVIKKENIFQMNLLEKKGKWNDIWISINWETKVSAKFDEAKAS